VFTLRTSRRDDLQAHLRARQIGCTVYYPLPLHLQPALAHLGYGPGDFPEAEAWSREALSIPLFPEMTDEQGDEVAAAIREFFA
jgi:dTDP-4-amino-4,6-dideoxygalactose transaminase